MADSETEHTVELRKLAKELDVLSTAAREQAVDFHAASHVHNLTSGPREVHDKIAVKLFAIAGVVSLLSQHAELWIERRLITRQEVKDFREYLRACGLLFNEFVALLDRDEEFVVLESERNHRPSLVLGPRTAQSAESSLQELYQVLVTMTMNVRKECLSPEKLSESSTLGSRRLGEALENFNSKSSNSKNTENKDPTSKKPEVVSKTTGPSESSLKDSGFPQILKGSIPPPPISDDTPVWAYNNWPPWRATSIANGSHAAQLQPSIRDENDEDQDTEDVPEDTPAATRESSPESEHQAKASRKGKEPVTKNSSKDDNTAPNIEGIPAAALDSEKINLSKKASNLGEGSSSKNNHPTPPTGFSFSQTSQDRLEAFILRMETEARGDIISWLPRIESLYLHDRALEDHRAKVNSKNSLISDMGNILPEQIRLIQNFIKIRGGNIFSVEQCAPVDMDTPMGTMQVKPVIFTLSIAQAPPRASLGNHVPQGLTNAVPSPFPIPSIFKPVPPQDPFNQVPSLFPPTSIAANQIPPPFAGNPTGIAEYRAYLEKYNEQCFLLETDPTNPRGIVRYMTITTLPPPNGHNLSFEEMRLRDYQAGRKVSDTPKKEEPFGGQYVAPPRPSYENNAQPSSGPHPAPTVNPFLARSPFTNLTTGATQNVPAPTGGLFGRPGGTGFGAFGPPQNQGGNIFAQRAAGFGQPANTPTTGLFGQPANSATTGLFGQPLPTGTTPTPSGGNLSGHPTNIPATNVFSAPPVAQSGCNLFAQQHGMSVPSVNPNNQSMGFVPTPAQPPSGGLFGQVRNPPGTQTFGTPPPVPILTCGMYGSGQGFQPGRLFANNVPSQTQSSGGLFGQPANTPPGGLFGPRANLPPHNGGLFGQPVNPPSTDPFALPPPPAAPSGPSVFASTGPPPAAQTNPSVNIFVTGPYSSNGGADNTGSASSPTPGSA
ncbi:hypothetical protein IQ07DRAFT_626521 [Pyrenochaeta sp. DS3sAY3a]|nr:hypothetical protein IQ07DRAFT_626521 [Pyrenochaeta sp. DS3sAY3a]